ncbi:MAG: substrate binding domain-containing protein, partial [Rhodomicrobiaceae bacterium]
TRRMSLTEAGSLYYDRVVRILDDLEEADSVIGPMQQVPSGLLRINAPMTLTLLTLSEAMPRFLAQYPQLSVDLRMDDRRINIVDQGIDVAIRVSDQLEDSSLIARKLMAMPHVLCGAPSYFEQSGVPATPRDLTMHNCIQFTLSGHVDEWTFTKDEETIRMPINGRYKVSSSLALRDALWAGFGLSLIPRLYVEDDLAAGRLRTVLDEWSTVETTVYAVYPSRRFVVAKLRAFLDFLVEELNAYGASR